LRLDKYLSHSGEGTRSDARKAICSGLVTVNRTECRQPGAKIGSGDIVCFAGNQIGLKEHTYLMLNKPGGYLSATEDKKEKTVIDLLDSRYKRLGLSSAGRLDKDAEGLMILTDDGGLIHRIISPKMHVSKKYYVRAEGVLPGDLVRSFEKGLKIGAGMTSLPAELEIMSIGGISEFYLVIYEGKFHQVKRMFASVGMKVVYLRRISIKGVELDGSLLPGMYRELYETEIAGLKE
jgi:16S rRNA pseudouridine516 synthase